MLSSSIVKPDSMIWQSYVPEEESITGLPYSVWIDVFSKLPIKDLACCSRVCSGWKNVCEDSSIWYVLLLQTYGYKAVAACEDFIENRGFTWKQAFPIFPILYFISKSTQLDEKQNTLVYKNFKYSISKDGKNIACRNLETQDTTIFRGRPGERIALIAAEGDSLFLLSRRGRVDQLNRFTGHLVQEFDASFTGEISNKNTFFSAEQGWIVLKNSSSPILQRIYYAGSTLPLKPCENASFTTSKIFAHKGNLLWIRLTDSVRAFDLREGQFVWKCNLRQTFEVTALHFHNEKLYVFGEYGTVSQETDYRVYIFDLETGKRNTVVRLTDFINSKFVLVIRNLVFSLETVMDDDDETKSYFTFAVYDLDQKKKLGIIDDVMKEDPKALLNLLYTTLPLLKKN